jgi:hypothetical protein
MISGSGLMPRLDESMKWNNDKKENLDRWADLFEILARKKKTSAIQLSLAFPRFSDFLEELEKGLPADEEIMVSFEIRKRVK